MPRAILPFALVLALVTGVVLNATRLVVLTPAVSREGDPYGQNAAIVLQFYAAVNSALASGDVASLDGFVGTDFVDHGARPGVTADKAGLVRSLQALHASAPALRLTILDVVAQDDRVVARVKVEGGEDAAFLGLPIAADQLWGTVDVFRVAAGHLVERWGDPSGLALYEPLVAATVPLKKPTRKAVTLERWTYAPDAGETWINSLGFIVILVDTGSLTIDLDAPARGPASLIQRGRAGSASGDRPVVPGTTTELGSGDTLVVSQGDRFIVRNDGAMPAVALVVVAMTSTPPMGGTTTTDVTMGAAATMDVATEATGVVHSLLARGSTTKLPAGKSVLAIGRASLAPGASIPSHSVRVAEFVAVEEGEMWLTADGGDAWLTSTPGGVTQRAGAGAVPMGGGAQVDAGTSVGYRTAGDVPLGIVIVSFGGVPTDGATAVSADGV